MIFINRIIIELKRAEYIRTGDQSPLRIDLSLTSMSLCYANDRYICPKSFWSFCAFDFSINSLPLSLHVLVNSDQVLQLASYFAFFFCQNGLLSSLAAYVLSPLCCISCQCFQKGLWVSCHQPDWFPVENLHMGFLWSYNIQGYQPN